MKTMERLKPGRALLLALATTAAALALACSSSGSSYQSTATQTSGALAPVPTSVVTPTTAAPSGNVVNSSTPASGTADPLYADASDLEVSVGQGDLGSYLTGPSGHTLYVFLHDAPDASNCTGGCLQTWPPLLLAAGQSVEGYDGASGTFGTIDTPAGKQVTYNKAPLYYFAADAQAGDTKGNLVGNVWFVARPDTASTSIVGVSGSGSSAFLVGPTGMTLYVFAKDTSGVSNCNDQCLANWPALKLPSGVNPTAVSTASGAVASLTRSDGSSQLTYKGAPLYYFAADKLPGDTKGDGVGGVWSIARP
jgi:predicted lipoprotein with Yx(FWY)xxD motif